MLAERYRGPHLLLCVHAAFDEAHTPGTSAWHLTKASGKLTVQVSTTAPCSSFAALFTAKNRTLLPKAQRSDAVFAKTQLQRISEPQEGNGSVVGLVQEEERERRMDYVPEESAVSTELIEVICWVAVPLKCP